MEARKFYVPEIVLGDGALNLAGQYACNFDAKKVFLVTDPGIITAGWVKRVQNSLEKAGLKYVTFSDVTANPKDTEVMSGAEMYNREQCDFIIAIGGGSPIDCAKGIGIVATNNEHILQFEGVDKVSMPCPPLICIPTTAGSAADVSQFAIVIDTSRKVKVAIVSKGIVPDVSLIDPVTTTTMPAHFTVSSGMDALTHGIEAFVSNASSSITNLNALESIRLIKENLQNAIEHPLEIKYRDQTMLGSLLAGFAFSNASLGLVHAMAHAVGGRFDAIHGECNAVLLEHVIDFNFDSAFEQYCQIAEALDIDLSGLSYDQKKTKIIESIIGFRKDVGIYFGLSELGVRKADIPLLAKYAYNDPCVATNPREPSIEDIEKIYEKAL